jgi:DNA-binding MurR/RpiR family transcriptional regulator
VKPAPKADRAGRAGRSGKAAKVTKATETPGKLAERIAGRLPQMTRSEREIADYMLGHLHLLPFENAAAIAERVGVSAMTVGRFLRGIGYSGIGEVKAELRQQATEPGLLIQDRLERIHASSGAGEDLRLNLQLEVNALIAVYELVGTPLWERTLQILCACDQVFVAGFQTLAGLAADFAARLQYLRPEVHVLDGRDGIFADLFAGSARTPSLVLFEMRRYTHASRLLAAQARAQGVALVIICDRHCHWAHDHTENVFSLNTDSRLFWDSQAPFVSLSNLMFDHIVRRLDGPVDARLKAMTALQEQFGAFRAP